MTKLPKYERSEQKIIKEFWPRNEELETTAGRLIVRATNYGSSLAKFDEFFDIMVADALTFVPPIELHREDVEIVHYAGDSYRHTFGMEVSISQGHVVPEEYTRISCTERTL